MGKTTKISLILIIILIFSLILMTFLYFRIKNIAKENLNHVLEVEEENSELNKRISELEKISNVSVMTNTTKSSNKTMSNSNTNMEIIDNQSKEQEIPDYSIDIDKVKIEVDNNKVTSTNIPITIVNDNENEIHYDESFSIQKQENNKWKDLDYLPDISWNAIGLITKGNDKTGRNLNIEYYYGKLDKGKYRVIKQIDGTNIYSNAFEID